MRKFACASLCLLAALLSGCGTLEITVDRTPTPDAGAIATIGVLQTQNAQLATAVATLAAGGGPVAPVPPTLTPGAAPVATSAPGATRITFLEGATVGVVSAPIEAGQAQTYVLQAFQGQPMFVYVGSINNEVTLSIKRQDGTIILSADEHKISWQGSLPGTEDYYVTVHGGPSTENFSLTVTVPWRIQFSAGADSATVSGKTVAGYGVSYAIFAGKGQTMNVNLENLSSKASLSIYGFTDGQQYLASGTGQMSYQFVLPATQDYIVVVLPADGSVVNYIMTVKVQ